jgi:hypothetical protein
MISCEFVPAPTVRDSKASNQTRRTTVGKKNLEKRKMFK